MVNLSTVLKDLSMGCNLVGIGLGLIDGIAKITFTVAGTY